MNKYSLNTFFSSLAIFHQITKDHKDILIALVSFDGKDGCYPSHATLASRVGVCERTVRNALNIARENGWISWTNERQGTRQSTNRYRFLVTMEQIKQIRSAFEQLKGKTAKIQRFFRRQNLPRSSYYYINKERLTLSNTLNQLKNKLSPFQSLFQINPDLALQQLLNS